LCSAPEKFYRTGVEGLVFKNQFGVLLGCQAVLDEREIQILVAAIKFVADDGMADVREVDADLMLAAGAGNDSEQRKTQFAPAFVPGI